MDHPFRALVFVFLAGTVAYLYQPRGKSPREASWFLLTRGLWLVVLEWTIIRWAWMFNFNYTSELLFVQVIWVIGVSMIVLAGLHLPLGAAALGIAMIAGHNLLDGIAPESWAAGRRSGSCSTSRRPSRSGVTRFLRHLPAGALDRRHGGGLRLRPAAATPGGGAPACCSAWAAG